MMDVYYSATTNGFYDDKFKNEKPEDAVSVGLARHAAIMSKLSSGEQLSANADGKPVTAKPVVDMDAFREAAARAMLVGYAAKLDRLNTPEIQFIRRALADKDSGGSSPALDAVVAAKRGSASEVLSNLRGSISASDMDMSAAIIAKDEAETQLSNAATVIQIKKVVSDYLAS